MGFTGQADIPRWAGFGIPYIMWAFFTGAKPDGPKSPGCAIEPAQDAQITSHNVSDTPHI